MNPPATAVTLPLPEVCPQTLRLLAQRRSSKAPTLTAPGPEGQALEQLLSLALRVPDHGAVRPWRLILLRGATKERFVAALEGIAAQREDETKALAALTKMRVPPVTVAVVSRPCEGKIPVWEQQLSAGALCMNLLLAAHASGWGANWITGWYAYDRAALERLGLSNDEQVAGFVHLGTPGEAPRERPRPELADILSEWS